MDTRPTRNTESRNPSAAIITSNFWPEESGIGQVTTEFARFMAAEGVQVRVATARPYYPAWSIYPGYRGLSGGRTQHFDNLVIYRAWHYTSQNPTPLQRIAHELTLTLFSTPNILRALSGADVAFIVSPDLFHAFAASIIARLLRVRRVVMIQDILPDAAIELGMLTNPWVIRVARGIAHRIYGLADEIYTLSEGMRERLLPLVKPPKEVKLLPNTVDIGEIVVGEQTGNLFRAQFVPEGCFAIVHAGNMGEKQDLDLLLNAAVILREHENIHFYVFGDGATKNAFLKRRQFLDLTNVSHFPFQSREMFAHIVTGADVVLVSQLPKAIDIFLPSKLVTALGAGAMIIAACAQNSETSRLIAASQGGLWIPASDADALAKAILEIRDGSVDSQGYRARAKDYAKRCFERKAVYSRVVKMVRSYSPTLMQE